MDSIKNHEFATTGYNSFLFWLLKTIIQLSFLHIQCCEHDNSFVEIIISIKNKFEKAASNDNESARDLYVNFVIHQILVSKINATL